TKMSPRGTDASDTELEVLKALWEIKSGTVRDVGEVLLRCGHQWAYTTIQTLLIRLQSKGLVTVRKVSTPHTYEPAVTREKLLGMRLKELALNLCDGTPTPLVRALVSQETFSRDDIARFRNLLDELEGKQG
ncbi:MAG: BlaI/MecI/CopY family transcriptional regulator, partial [Candidatus Hydrogenedentes bacterium]|nr:BlaI/MecI/CopY family transcriptional regulator [Candidatus Hydrogenedentota bacterium]